MNRLRGATTAKLNFEIVSGGARGQPADAGRRKAKAALKRQQTLAVTCGRIHHSGFMRFWLIFILIFFAVRYLLPIVLRLALNGFVRKQMRDGGFVVPPQTPPTGGGSATHPGEVRVDYVPPTPPERDKPNGFKGGEYVDFEEVK